METKFICKYCGKEFKTSRQLGGHVSRCKENPNYNRTIRKINETKHKSLNFTERVLICKYCGREYKLLLSDTQYKRGKYRTTCSSDCAHKLTTSNSPKTRIENISNSLKRHNIIHKNYKVRICEYCGKEFTSLDYNKSRKYCSDLCLKSGRSKKLSESAKRNKLGGLKPDSTHRNYKRGYYKGIWCDSSWELAFIVYCFDHSIIVERNYNYKEYTFENKIYKFYPDFIVNGELIEIKGFITPKNKAKIEQNKDVKFIYKSEIKPYLEYVINIYGEKFYDILYDK